MREKRAEFTIVITGMTFYQAYYTGYSGTISFKLALSNRMFLINQEEE